MSKTKKAAPKAAPKTTPKAKGRMSKSEFLDQTRRELENAKRSAAGDYWKPKEGRSVLRIFTHDTSDGPQLFVKDVRHWGVDGNQKSNIACLGDDCPVCALRDEVPDKAWEKVRPQTKYLVNAVVRKADGSTDKQVIAQLPKTVYTKLLNYVCEEDPDVVDCIDLEHGYDFKVIRSGTGLETDYQVIPMPSPSKVGMTVKTVDLNTKKKQPQPEEEVQAIANAIKEW